MKPFISHRGIVAILDKANVDTDQIIPKQFLKKITRTGFGEHLFHDWRYLTNGKDDPDFELNRKCFSGATILLTRNNFGCGSSREHAVWAIQQYGFKVVIASAVNREDSKIPAFADIFCNNSAKNGLLTVEMDEKEADEIFLMIDQYDRLEATVNLERQLITIHSSREKSFHFEIDPAVKQRLITGLDDIRQTLQCDEQIRSFEAKHDVQMSS